MRVLAGTGQCDAPGMMDGGEGRDAMGIELLAFVRFYLVQGIIVPLHCVALRLEESTGLCGVLELFFFLFPRWFLPVYN